MQMKKALIILSNMQSVQAINCKSAGNLDMEQKQRFD